MSRLANTAGIIAEVMRLSSPQSALAMLPSLPTLTGDGLWFSKC
jgi:hypothetical protein